MLTICRHRTFAALKKIAADKVSRLNLEKHLIEEMQVDELDNLTEGYRDIIAASVDKLAEQQRKVYIMSRYERMKYEDIAQKLGLSPTTVKKHIQLAVRFIQKDLSSRKMDTGLFLLILTTPLLF